ncbi:MAG: helix-turn-helix domain-containing protein [Bacteroidales bacterium]|nr:helix-turn-helix domain-containing protein [Candidatus Latescibacterota bacterium]
MINNYRKHTFRKYPVVFRPIVCQCLFAVLILLIPVITSGTGYSGEETVTLRWNTVSGLPGEDVRALARSDEGYLWIGTGNGLVRFDGFRFVVFDQYNTPELGTNGILSLFVGEGNILWIGTDGEGMTLLRNGFFERFDDENKLADGHIRAIHGDPFGNIWIATELGIHRFDGESIFSFGLEDGFADDLFTSVTIDGWGHAWMGTLRGGIGALYENTVQLIDYDPDLASLSVLSLESVPDGRVFVGTMTGLYSIWPHTGIFEWLEQMGTQPVTALSSRMDGTHLAGTMTAGLKMMNGDEVSDLLMEEDLRYSHIQSIFTCTDGSIWAGTRNRGLIQVRNARVGRISEAQGLPTGSVYPIIGDDNGTLWIGSGNNGLFVSRNGSVTEKYSVDTGLAGDMVRALLLHGMDEVWVGTMAGGISILSGDRITNLDAGRGLPSNNITAFIEGGDGCVLVGTDNGVARVSFSEKGANVEELVLAGETVRTFYKDIDGSVLAATRNGIWKLGGDVQERLEYGGSERGSDILSLHRGIDGRLWAGTAGNGLMRIGPDSVRTCDSSDGLPGDYIYSITGDELGVLWMSCEKGVFRIDIDSVGSFFDGAAVMLVPELFDEAEGMPASACSGYCSPSYWVSGDGGRLYPTTGGIAVFDGPGEARIETVPVVIIESMTVDDDPVDIHQIVKLSNSAGKVEFRFTALVCRSPEKCRFLCRLVGPVSSLSTVMMGKERVVSYRDLPAGDYRMTVRAAGNGGRWSRNTATAIFSIGLPFYRTARFGFLSTSSVILASFVWFAGVRYSRKRKQRSKYRTVTIGDDQMEKALDGLVKLMEEDKIFLDPDLTLKKLAGMLRIHYNQLSMIINGKFDVSFNDFVNGHRVKAVKEMFSDPANDNRNILEIAYDAGFYSKSTFNTAFRKFTGTTPSKYRKRTS